MNDLAAVFSNIYHFEVKQRVLGFDDPGCLNKNRAQHQMCGYLLEFMKAHDAEDSLLIIYYAGHGWATEGGRGGEFMMGGLGTFIP